jgi:hypothetical protein
MAVEEDTGLPMTRTAVALAERVAVVETKVGALKEDTTVIRSSMHDINNEIMRFVVLEERCAASLVDLVGNVRNLAAEIAGITAARNQAEGAWAATVRISAAIVASVGILGTLGAGLAWAVGHLSLH